MPSATDIRRFLGKLILVIFMVVHAPVSGVMTAAQALAHSDPAGAGVMVICLDGSFTEIDAPNEPPPNSTGAHECLCPCATLGGESALESGPQPYVAVFLESSIGQVEWSVHAEPFFTLPPQSGRGSPRAPPFSNI